MKVLAVFLLFVSCSFAHGFGVNPFSPQKSSVKGMNEKDQESLDDLEGLTEKLDRNMRKLLYTLTHEHTTEEESFTKYILTKKK